MRRASLPRLIAPALCALAVSGPPTPPAFGQTLDDTLAATYCTNNELAAQRARLEATGERVEQARGGWRPRVSGEVFVGAAEVDNEFTGTQSLSSRTFALNVEQPLYRGGRTAAETRAARAEVGAGEAIFVTVEQNVLLEAATAYLAVAADMRIVALRRSNVEVLTERLTQTEARFREGEVTRTDVAQAEARLATARAQERAAEAALETSRATFERVTSLPVWQIRLPDTGVDLPPSRTEALNVALLDNPRIVAAMAGVDAADAGVDVARSALRPNASIVGSVGRQNDQFPVLGETDVASIGVRLTIPLYQAGIPSSRTREARANARAQAELLNNSRRVVEQRVREIWEQREASRTQIEALEIGIAAAELALTGVTQEAAVGQRTVLDTLDAEQELLGIRVDLVEARRDELIAEYRLLAEMGGFTAAHLNLGLDCSGDWAAP